MLIVILCIISAYIWASIPTAYLVARYYRGIDIREYGSGNVGASNVYMHVGKRIGFLLGGFDCIGKGTLPIVVVALFDQSLAVQVSVGFAAIAGHIWTPFLRFNGGRGASTAIGVLFGFQMWPELFVLTIVMICIGRLVFNDSAIGAFVSILGLPVLTFLTGLSVHFERSIEIIVLTIGIGVLLMLRRITADLKMPAEEYSIIQVVGCRILWDRDIPKRKDWTYRRPSS